MKPDLALKIQQAGGQLYGDEFLFLAHALEQFSKSDPASRERTKNGGIAFAASPLRVNADTIIFSATTHPEFASYRLGVDLVSPFGDYIFQHKDTTWVNINNRIGMKMYFPKNSSQILDFFASLVVERLNQGKRPLLIAKKVFITFCAVEIERRFRALGEPNLHVLYEDINDADLQDRNVVPLINYGVIGINSFEDFDCAFCLTGYYVNEKIVNAILQDVFATDIAVPIQVKTMGKPHRRWAGVADPHHRFYNVNGLAPLALRQEEFDKVVQAVGRVRPFTKPREIITFQCDAHPSIHYDQEFSSLAEARAFFGIDNQRQRRKAMTAEAVMHARQQGMKQREAARALGVSVRTIKRYWNQ